MPWMNGDSGQHGRLAILLLTAFATFALLTTVGCGGKCGNGTLDEGEACDDGNRDDGDGCSAECGFEGGPLCGDGVLSAGEGCDDGNNTNGDGCSALCQIEPMTCGNGMCEMAMGETCTNCIVDCETDPACVMAVCGDGTVEGLEQCDDGNTTDGDGCDSMCMTEGPVCGNMMVEIPETCDDGNTVGGDGCSATCQLEGLTCPMTTAVNCGDVIMDDNNNGMSFVGQWACFGWGTAGPELGYELTTTETVPVDLVLTLTAPDLDLVVIADEGMGCDPMSCEASSGAGGMAPEMVNFVATAGTTYYIFVDGYTEDGDPGGPFTLEINCGAPAVCGDGVVELGEECDDMNTTAGDGCDATCVQEPNFLCTGAPSVCVPAVGGSSMPNLAIPDAASTGAMDTLTVTDTCFIDQVVVDVNITHTWVGDLVLTLTHDASGTTVGLLDRPGVPPGTFGNGDDLAGTYFFADGGLPVPQGGGAGTLPTGTYAPEGPGMLSDLMGLEAMGTWTLFVSDNAGMDTGTVVSWGVTMTCGIPAVCGDGIISTGEGCDDSNTTDGDGCSATCQPERSFACAGEPSVCVSTCGDGVIDIATGEECDDDEGLGSTTNGDGCDTTCGIEAGWSCLLEPSQCFAFTTETATPGTAIPDSDPLGITETLNFPTTPCAAAGVTVDLDITHANIVDLVVVVTAPSGTSAVLHQFGTGGPNLVGNYPADLTPVDSLDMFIGEDATGNWALDVSDFTAGSAGTLNSWSVNVMCVAPPTCGDGTIFLPGVFETCDDMNMADGDGCSSSCQTERSFTCTGEPSVCVSTCGDGVIDTATGEECDDNEGLGSTTNGDGCDTTCGIEVGFSCMGVPSVCVPGETGTSSPNLAIPDGDPAGTTDVITIANTCNIAEIIVTLDIDHAWVGDLIVTLTHDTGATTVGLLDQPGVPASMFGNEDDLMGVYVFDDSPSMPFPQMAATGVVPPDTYTPEGPGALGDFVGLAANSTYTLFLSDNAAPDPGTLYSWTIDVICL